MLTIENLARFQFAMTTVFHFFIVPLSVGLAFMTMLMEIIYVKTGDEKWKTRTKFFGVIMLLSFAVGVVTGIIQEFQFGMNWSEYSRFVGDIFGAPLAVEALLAFFMESTFIGIWMFGWDRLGKKLHMLTIILVFLGTTLSSLWILAANSWMQNPVGYKIQGGRATLTSFSALLTNPQTVLEFSHVVTGFLLTGGFVAAGIAAFQVLRKRDVDIFKPIIRLGLIVALIGSIGNFIAGDQQMLEVRNSQPMKFAVAEGITKTEKAGESSSWDLIAFFDHSNQKVMGVQVPMMLSILTFHNTTNTTDIQSVDELNAKLAAQYPEAAKQIDGNFVPPFNAIFWTFRVMSGVSMFLILISAVGIWLTRKKGTKLYESKFGLRLYGWSLFLPFIAITCGWLVTELGRYPWTVYGLFTMKDSVSPNVSVGSLLFSNIVYFILYSILGIVMVVFIRRAMQKSISNTETSYVSLDPLSKESMKSDTDTTEEEEV